MARGTSLGELVNQLRIATRRDTNPALSINTVDQMKQQLREEQERLYDEFDWPFLKITADKPLEAGSRYYDVPAEMNLERIQKVDVYYGGRWLPVERGISLEHYNACDSDIDQRNDPASRWDVKDTGTGEQIEVWPIPASDGNKLRFTGIRKLRPLIENAHIADLDDQIIVGYVAAEFMTAEGKSDVATAILAKTRRRLDTLQGRVTKTRKNQFVLGGAASDCDEHRDRRPQVAYVRNP